jgi:hypothetical protein
MVEAKGGVPYVGTWDARSQRCNHDNRLGREFDSRFSAELELSMTRRESVVRLAAGPAHAAYGRSVVCSV